MLTGNITITTVHSTDENDYISIRIEDESSGQEFLETKMTFEDFGKAVNNHSSIPVQFRLHAVERVGKTLETKQVEVTVPIPNECSWQCNVRCKEALDAVLSPHLEGGWVGSRDRAFNHHYCQHNPDQTITVKFPLWRWV